MSIKKSNVQLFSEYLLMLEQSRARRVNLVKKAKAATAKNGANYSKIQLDLFIQLQEEQEAVIDAIMKLAQPLINAALFDLTFSEPNGPAASTSAKTGRKRK